MIAYLRRSSSQSKSWLAWLGILTLAWLFAAVGLAADLPLESRSSMLKEQAVAALKSGDDAAFFAAMDEFRALEKEGATVPAGLFLAEADKARSAKDPVRCARAFDDYFRVASPEGDAYNQAMGAYKEFKESVPVAVWPTLESMELLPAGKVVVAGNEVRIKSFSLGQHEVTRGQFLAFVTETGYVMPAAAVEPGDAVCDLAHVDWKKPGFDQTDDDPVVCVSWRDARAYIDWLNQWSGLKFRLPSEAEWEYAARAGAITAYWYGDDYDPGKENGRGAAGRDVWERGTAPVGSFPANPFGLRDMLGNVSEWVEDCAGASDAAVPADGSARRDGDCKARVVRGGNWMSDATESSASYRTQPAATYRATNLGFRLVVAP